MMKNFCRLVAAGMIAATGVSCTTAYDAYGRPVQVVDPAAAALGVAAAGLVGYALASDSGHHHGHGRYNHYQRGYYGNGCGYGW